MVELLKTLTLANGITLHFEDASNRYFGDFHRLCIKVKIALPQDLAQASGLPRERTWLEKYLEKMGVPSAAVEAEREALIESFLATSKGYLEKPAFPQQLLVKLQLLKPKPVFLRN